VVVVVIMDATVGARAQRAQGHGLIHAAAAASPSAPPRGQRRQARRPVPSAQHATRASTTICALCVTIFTCTDRCVQAACDAPALDRIFGVLAAACVCLLSARLCERCACTGDDQDSVEKWLRRPQRCAPPPLPPSSRVRLTIGSVCAVCGVRTQDKKNLAGFVGFANLPNQVHRRSVKKGFSLTLLVVGEGGLGKATLINTLFGAKIIPARTAPAAGEPAPATVSVKTHTAGTWAAEAKGKARTGPYLLCVCVRARACRD
jgi:hypothetical protein